jgi:hypothetical protein
MLENDLERLFSKIHCDDFGCWLWRAGTNRAGYGQAYFPSAKTALAHRIVYELYRGPIPAGLQLDHLCYNSACVNPFHLEPVTPAENLRRCRSGPIARAHKIANMPKIPLRTGPLPKKRKRKVSRQKTNELAALWSRHTAPDGTIYWSPKKSG